MTTETTRKLRKPPARKGLRPILHPAKWYWADEVRQEFLMSRETIADLKRKHPNHVCRSRRGDMIRGAAVLSYCRSK